LDGNDKNNIRFLRANAPKSADKCRCGFSQITDIHSVNGTLCYWLTAQWQKKKNSERRDIRESYSQRNITHFADTFLVMLSQPKI